MATTQQKIFSKIVLHNKLLEQAELEEMFEQFTDPEIIAKYLVKSGKLPDKKADQLLALYHKQLEKQGKSEAAGKPASAEHKESAAGSDSQQQIDEAAGIDEVADSDSTAEARPDYGGLPPIKVDLGGDEDEEDLPLLERDTDSPDTSPAGEAPRTTVGGVASEDKAVAVDPKAKEVVHEILREARQMNASDVHITAGLVPMVRRAAKLTVMDRPVLSPNETEQALLAMLDDGRRAQFLEHRDLDFCYDGGEGLGRFRTNFLSEQAGMDAVFRLIDTEVPLFEKLGLPKRVEQFTEYSQGMVLITGPKGSGKTTTLAAMVDLLNRTRTEHIIVIEDPIEFVHKNKKAHINQREVGTHTKSFGNAMRAALREAPDIIVVGEMRDLETTSLAISAAETGHLVLATLHTPDALRTIGRVLDVFPPKEQGQIRAMLSESLRGIVSQQLVPTVDGNSLELALEILVNTPAIGNMIREDRTFQLRGMMQTGRKLGMILLDDSLVRLVNEGRISKEEAFSRATEEEYVRKELGE